jgi:hypothetical protein
MRNTGRIWAGNRYIWDIKETAWECELGSTSPGYDPRGDFVNMAIYLRVPQKETV